MEEFAKIFINFSNNDLFKGIFFQKLCISSNLLLNELISHIFKYFITIFPNFLYISTIFLLDSKLSAKIHCNYPLKCLFLLRKTRKFAISSLNLS